MAEENDTQKPSREAVDPASAGSALVSVRHHQKDEPENASTLVWWIARLAVFRQPFMTAQVGDIVVEQTHMMMLAKHKLGLLSAIGELIAIEQDQFNRPEYVIKTIEGKIQRWTNAHMLVVERQNVTTEATARR